MRFHAIAMIVALSLPATAHAASESMRPSAAQIVAALQVTKQLDGMLTPLVPMVANNIIADMSKSSNAMLQPYADKPGGIEGLTKIIGQELLKAFQARYGKFSKLYEDHLLAKFSDAELRDAVAFAQTPAGRKLLAMGNDIEARMKQHAGAIGMEASLEAMPRAFARGASEVLK